MALHRRSRCEKSKGYLKSEEKGKSLFKCPESVKWRSTAVTGREFSREERHLYQTVGGELFGEDSMFVPFRVGASLLAGDSLDFNLI